MAVKAGFVRRLASVALLVSLFVGLVPATASAVTAAEIRNQLYEKVNTARRNHGLRTLRTNAKTAEFAKDHAGWLSRSSLCKFNVAASLLCHDDRLEVRSEIPSDWEWWGENLASSTTQPGIATKLHRMLMQSPGHRANILKSQATHMGFGVVKSNGRVYVVQRFVDRR